MGVMVRGDASGSSIGVAPGARWIAARVFNDQGSATASAIHLAFQWVLDPDHDPSTADAPQVVNNSWTMTAGCNLEFEADINALRAALILPVVAAGNAGPNASTDFSPANNPGALSIGSTSSLDVIANNSSRGPTSCGGTQRTFPSLVAPGVSIRTSDLFHGYTTPVRHIAGRSARCGGARAGVDSADPGLSVAAQETALTSTAVDLGTPGPDNTYGAGGALRRGGAGVARRGYDWSGGEWVWGCRGMGRW